MIKPLPPLADFGKMVRIHRETDNAGQAPDATTQIDCVLNSLVIFVHDEYALVPAG